MTERKNTSGTMHRDYILGVYPERSRRKLAPESGNAFFASRMDLRDYYAYARYYDPRLGRFMSPDPLAGSVGNPQSLNRYTYVLNNPESFIDPTGLQCSENGDPIPFPPPPPNCSDLVWCNGGGSGGSGGGTGSQPCSMLAGSGSFGYGTILGSGLGGEFTCPPGDGKGGGNPPTHTGPPSPQTSQSIFQEQQGCVSNFYNSKMGKAVQFGSPLSLLPVWNPGWGSNLAEWSTAITGKFGGLFGSGATSGTTEITTLSGTTTVGSPLELGAEAVFGFLEKVATPVFAGAAAVDSVAHATCAIEANPSIATSPAWGQ